MIPIVQSTNIFQGGWNHQPDYIVNDIHHDSVVLHYNDNDIVI